MIEQGQPPFNEADVEVAVSRGGAVVGCQVISFAFRKALDADIGWVADNGVEASCLFDSWEAILTPPVEEVDAVLFFLIDHGHLLLLVEVGANEGVAAFDVVAQVGQGAFVEEAQDGLQALLGFAFEDFEQQGKFRRLDGLGVDVHAEDVVQEDAFAFGDGEFPVAGADLHENRLGAFGPFLGIVFGVEVAVPLEEILVGADEEGAGAAGGVEDLQFGGLPRCFVFEQVADGGLDDVVHDVGGGVIDAAGLLDFGLFLDHGSMAFGEADDLAEELLVHLAEDVRREGGEDVGRLGVVEAPDDVPEELVVYVKGKGEFVGGFMAALLGFEMEEAGVVAGVGLLEKLGKARIDAVAVGEGAEAAIVFDAAAFADAQENDAVYDPLDGEIEFALGKLRVPEGEVAGEVGAPGFDRSQEFVVNVGGAFGLRGVGELVE